MRINPLITFTFHSLLFFLLPISYGFTQDSTAISRAAELEEILGQENLADSLANEASFELIEIYEASGEYQLMADRSVRYFNIPPTPNSTLEKKKNALQRSISYEDQISDSTVVGRLYLKLAAAYFNAIQLDSAIESYSTALIKLSQEDTLLIADSYFFRGQAMDANSNMIAAMLDYQKALNLYESANDTAYEDYVRAGMAVLFSKYAIYDEAEKIRVALIERATENEDWESVGVQNFNRATDLGKQNDWENQLIYLKKADSLFRIANSDAYFIAQTSFAQSRAYARLQNLEQQSFYFERGKEYMANTLSLNSENPSYLMTSARYYFSLGDFKRVEQIAKNITVNLEKKGDFDEYLYGLELLSEAQEKQGKTEEALSSFKKYKDYKDSIFVANQSTSFAYYQTLYETEKKEVDLLKTQAEIEDLKIQNRQKTIIFIISLVVVLILGGYALLFNRYKSEQKKKALQQRFSQELLKTQETERKRISKDLHDGLGQSLLLIKNKVALNSSDNTGEMLDTAIDELRAIARSLHPMQLEKLGLSKAIEQMLNQIDSETEIFISSELDPLENGIPKETELQLYRIAQEVLNNVLKHSEAQALRFTLNRSMDNNLAMIIEDNGKGFDFSERFNDFQSLGLKTLKERAAAIGSKMKVSTEKGKGSKFEFIVHI